MSYTASTITQMTKMLRNSLSWLDQAEEYAKQRSFDPANLLSARLYPDMFPLYRQLQAASDAVKLAGARLSGKAAPVHPDGEQSLSDLRARLQETAAFLEGLSPADFEGADERVVGLSFLPGKGMKGEDYLREMAGPNFYFHLTTAYDILRHSGVLLGKRFYIGSLTLVDL